MRVGVAVPVACVHGLNVFLCDQNRLLAWLTGMASVGSAVTVWLACVNTGIAASSLRCPFAVAGLS